MLNCFKQLRLLTETHTKTVLLLLKCQIISSRIYWFLPKALGKSLCLFFENLVGCSGSSPLSLSPRKWKVTGSILEAGRKFATVVWTVSSQNALMTHWKCLCALIDEK